MAGDLVKYETEHGEVTLSPAIIKRYLVSGDPDKVTDQEVMMFLQLCRYQRLNPFLREAYLIKYGNEPATIVTGKECFTKRAASNPVCTGWEAGVIVQKQDGTAEYRTGTLVLPQEELVGGWAKVYRKDWQVPIEMSVSLKEYARQNREGKLQRNWATMPATMIRKVALVQALREAMPQEFAGLYAPEEMPVDVESLDTTPVQSIEQVQAEVAENSNQEQAPSDIATQLQIKKIYALARQLNVDDEHLHAVIQKRYGKASSRELTKAQASNLIDFLTKLAEAKANEHTAEGTKNGGTEAP